MAKQLTEAEEEKMAELKLKHPSASSCVWTYNMLLALENGVKGNKWFSLKDKICRRKTICYGFGAVHKKQGGPGVDNETIKMFEKQFVKNIDSLMHKLQNNEYQPHPVKRTYVDKPGSKEKRPLGIPTVRQRIVENAFKFALEPIFENEFLDCSFGFRPNRGCRDALRVVANNLADGYKFVIDADIKGYFDSIDHKLLMSFIEEHIADRWVLGYLQRFLKNDILDTHKRWSPIMGSPQGSVLSPLLSNIYLHKLDCRMTESGYKITRYADDFVVMCKTLEEAQAGLEVIKEVMDKLKLTLHPEKTKVVEVSEEEGFDFLGYRFLANRRLPRAKSYKAIRDKIKEKTRRRQGKSIKEVIKSLNPTLRGWYNYFKHLKNTSTYREIDKLVRRRLRSILAKFEKKYGSHRMLDNFRWPNKFFHNLGLVSLQSTHDKEVALRRGNL